MKLQEFLINPSEISPEEVQLLNQDLTSKTIDDIPSGSRKDLENYLSSALSSGAVETRHIEKLDKLLEQLRESV